MTRRAERFLALLALLAGALLLWRAAAEQSFTLDEPYHLLPGLQIYQHGANTLHLDHPPLVRLIAAWPLAGDEALAAPPLRFSQAPAAWQALFADPATTRRRILLSRGALIAAVALPLLLLLFAWGRRFGERTGFALAAIFLLSPLSLPYLPLVMTDAAATLGFLATVAAGTRFAEKPAPARALLLGLAFGLAIAAKFSGLLLAPALLAAFLFAARKEKIGRLLGAAALAAAGALLVVWLVYALANRGPAELSAAAIEDCIAGAGSAEVAASMAPAAPYLRRLAAVSPELGQLSAGVLLLAARDRVGVLASLAFGHLSTEGRWWYFPALLLVQTPLALLAAAALALRAGWRQGREVSSRRLAEPRWALPAVALVSYLAVAAFSRYNVGLRHLLPVLPFLLLPAACWAGRCPRRLLPLLAALALESALLAPLWISSTNTWWLGRHDPSRGAFSAFEYRHSLVALAREAAALGAGGAEPGEDRLRVFYPLLDDRELQAYFPAARVDRHEEPLESGWYAVNVQGAKMLEAVFRTGPRGFRLYRAYRQAGLPFYRRLQEIEARGEDRGTLAGATFRLYRVP